MIGEWLCKLFHRSQWQALSCPEPTWHFRTVCRKCGREL